jgi:hypothetical protein
MADPWGIFSQMMQGGALLFIFGWIISIGVVTLWLWILYTVIWQAVRRGLREYYDPQSKHTAKSLFRRKADPE